MTRILAVVFTVLVTLLPAPAIAADPMPQTSRSRSLDFEDEIVEGMNKNPFDSVISVGKNDAAARRRIYRTKTHYEQDVKRTVREMGLMQ